MKVLKYIAKTIGWIIVGIIGLILLFSAILQTKPAKRLIAETAQTELNKMMNAELQIGSISGNFFTGIGLENVYLHKKKDTVGFIPSLKLRYQLMPLLSGVIQVNQVEIQHPIIYLKQQKDSTWNLMHLFKESEKTDTTTTPFTMKIQVNRFSLSDGTVFIDALDSIYPKQIKNLNTQLSLFYSEDEMKLNLEKFQLKAIEPNLLLKNLTCRFEQNNNVIRVNNLLLQTEKNKLAGTVNYNKKQPKNSFAELLIDSIRTEEFQFLIPDYKIKLHPILSLKANFVENQTHLNIKIDADNQLVVFDLLSPDLMDYLNNTSKNPVHYSFNADFQKIDLRKIIADPSMQYQFTGKLTGKGEGIEPKTMKIDLDGNFKDMNLLKRKINQLVFAFKYRTGDLNGEMNAIGNFGKMKLVPSVKNVFSKNPDFTVVADAKNLDVAQVMLDPSMKSNLNLNLKLRGKGFDPKTMTLAAIGNMEQSSYTTYLVDHLNLNLSYQNGNGNGILVGSGNFGSVYLKPTINNLFGKSPIYTAELKTENLNLAKLMQNDSLVSDLNLQAQINGVGFDTKKMAFNATVFAAPSSFMGIKINQLASNIQYFDKNINIDSLLVKTETISLTANGNYSMNSSSDITLNANILNAKEIAAFAKIDSLETSGQIYGHLTGEPTNLHANLSVNLGNTNYSGYKISSLNGNVDGFITSKDTVFKADFHAGNLNVSDFKIDTIHLNASSNIHSTDFNLTAQGQDLKAGLDGNIGLGKDILISLNDVNADYKGSSWQMLHSPSTVRIGESEYEVNNLQLASNGIGSSDEIQIISANGIIRQKGEENFDLNVSNFSIPEALQLMNFNQNINGILNMSLYVRGLADKPLLDGGFTIDKAKYNNYGFPVFAGSFETMNGKIGIKSTVVPQDSGNLTVQGQIPFSMRLDSMTFKTPAQSDSIFVHLVADKLPLKMINSFIPMDEINGYLQSDLKVDGTLENPNPIGTIQLKDGKLKMKKYGIDYRKMLMSIDIQKDSIMVDSIYIRSKDGSMFAHGQLGFQSGFYNGELNKSAIAINFNNFNPVDNKNYTMQLSGDAGLHGTKNNLIFDGDLTIMQALLYLPAVMQLTGSSTTSDIQTPILLQELDRAGMRPDSIVYMAQKVDQEKEKSQTNYLKNLTGKVKVFIPRNVWIKNNEMRIELSGDLEVMKHPDFMELFGSVDVIRGQYEMLGKTFMVDNGTLTFQGGEELNPVVDIEASYTFRDKNRSEKKLILNATGELNELKFKFSIDNQSISEGDALSYILFGTNMDALASGQQATLSTPSAGDLAQTAAASLISSELTKLLGKTLNVDYVEMKTGSSFNNATFVVGKYITNKLFVSYEQRIGNFKDENTAGYEVKMEYELFRYLFFQLVSSPITNGADLIFKFDSNTNFKEHFKSK